MCSIKQAIIKEEQEQDQEEVKASSTTFRSTTDYILNKPLKPLPSALQKIIPSILSVIIKPDLSESYKPETPQQLEAPKTPPDSTAKPFTCFSPLPPHNCNLCNFSTSLKTALTNHMKISHRPSKILGAVKIQRFKYPKQFTCLECNFSTFSKLVHLKHASTKCLLLEKIQTAQLKCEFCGYITEINSDMKKHLWVQHQVKLKTFRCDHCDYVTDTERNLRRHLIKMHSYKENDFFQCNHCNYKTVSLGVLKKHEEVRHFKKKVYRFSCNMCDYGCEFKYTMGRHMLAKHSQKWFMCESCSYKTTSKMEFNHHTHCQ